MAKHRIVGINFDHMHMGDLLRQVTEHPDAEIVGVWHHEPETPRSVLDRLHLPHDLIYDEWRACMQQTEPTLAIVCAATGSHAEWTANVAAYAVDVLVEKPFAANLAEADAMTDAVHGRGRKLAINWPLAWYPPHRTTKRLIDEGRIGEVINIHYYDGNRGPTMHGMDKVESTPEEVLRKKQQSWFYKRSESGGSLHDYLGYGVTLGTWFMDGKKPVEVTSTVDQPEGLEVDEHSVTVVRYDTGLSKFETRWGTFTDPWTHQPQPKCGFVVCGTAGTIASYDFESTVRVQTADRPEGYDVPVDELVAPHCDPITYFLHCIDNDDAVAGPLSPMICRIGQQIVDTAFASACEKRTLPLIDHA